MSGVAGVARGVRRLIFFEGKQEEGERRDTALWAEIGKPARKISALKQKIGGDIDGKHPEEGS